MTVTTLMMMMMMMMMQYFEEERTTMDENSDYPDAAVDCWRSAHYHRASFTSSGHLCHQIFPHQNFQQNADPAPTGSPCCMYSTSTEPWRQRQSLTSCTGNLTIQRWVAYLSTRWAKNGLFWGVDNFAMVNGKRNVYMSKVADFC